MYTTPENWDIVLSDIALFLQAKYRYEILLALEDNTKSDLRLTQSLGQIIHAIEKTNFPLLVLVKTQDGTEKLVKTPSTNLGKIIDYLDHTPLANQKILLWAPACFNSIENFLTWKEQILQQVEEDLFYQKVA